MANIFDEVGEDLRRDQMARIWKRYNGIIIGLAVLIVVAVGGWRGYEAWSQQRSAAAAEAYLAALAKAEAGEHAAAAEDFVAFASDAPSGYAMLARFRAATERAAAGEAATALTAFEDIAADGKLPADLRELARIRAAMLAVDVEDLAAVQARVADLDAAGNPWRHTAREVVALSAMKAENWTAARTAVDSILADPEVPADLRQRAQILDGVIVATVGRTSTVGEGS